MKIAISGATGFVGAQCIRHFAKKGHEILALGRMKSPPEKIYQYADYLALDLKDPIPEIKADIMIHTAAMVSDRGSYEEFHEINVLGTQKLLESFNGKHFIFISSSSVYPFSSEEITEDQANEKELSNYGLSKLKAEQLLINKEYSFKTTVLRPRAIYGTHDRVLIPKILRMKKSKNAKIPGDLKIKTSLTHISNLIHAIECSLDKQAKSTGVYNVCDGRSYQLREVVQEILNKAFKKNITLSSLPINLIRALTHITNRLSIPFSLSPQSLKYLSANFVLDVSRIKAELGYQPKANFFDSMTEIDAWIQQSGVDFILSGNKEIPWTLNE